MRILISAAETSSDIHGARLLEALKVESNNKVEAFGIGGPELVKAGLEIVVPSRELMAMGASEVIARLPAILSAEKKVIKRCRETPPDVAVVIDYPDFHFKLSKKLKKLGVPVVDFVPPKVWVWRKSRIHKIKKLFSKVLLIFPFESELYAKYGVDYEYIGNPVLDDLKPLLGNRDKLRKSAGFGNEDQIILAQVGSRPAEVALHLEPVLDGIFLATQKLSFKPIVLMAFPDIVKMENIRDRISAWKKSRQHTLLPFDLRVSKGDAQKCMCIADVGIVKSGTSTLEAGVLGLRHAVYYRASWISEFLYHHVVRYRDPIGLSNLFTDWRLHRKETGREAFRELVGRENVKAEKIAKEVVDMFLDKDVAYRMDSAVEEVRDAVQSRWDESSATAAARAVLSVKPIVPETPWYKAVGNRLLSFAWSMINSANSRLSSLLRRKIKLGSRVISVGNIQAGGSGKTPVVIQIAREAHERNQSVCVLTRGYKSHWEKTGGVIEPGAPPTEAEACGDEAALLQEQLPFAWIGVGADRHSQYKKIVQKKGSEPDLTIIDDGFQNHRIEKDIELIALTSRTRSEVPFRNWNASLKRADLVLWTKGTRPPQVQAGVDVVKSSFVYDQTSTDSFWLVTGLGDNLEAKRQLAETGFQITQHIQFPDHHSYSLDEAIKILDRAKAAGAKVLLTGKDWAKWRGFQNLDRSAIEVVEPSINIKEGKKIWDQKLWGGSSSRYSDS